MKRTQLLTGLLPLTFLAACTMDVGHPGDDEEVGGVGDIHLEVGVAGDANVEPDSRRRAVGSELQIQVGYGSGHR